MDSTQPLRRKLAADQTATANAPAAPGATTEDLGTLYEVDDAGAVEGFVLEQDPDLESYAFPYSHFLYAKHQKPKEGDETLIIRVATHKVVAIGLNLRQVRDDLVKRRMKFLRKMCPRHDETPIAKTAKHPIVKSFIFDDLETEEAAV